MPHISIRDLQKMSSEKIARLDGPTPVKSGRDTVAILTPVRKRDPERLLALEEELARKNAARRAAMSAAERDDEDRLLSEWGVDLTLYDDGEIGRLQAEVRALKPR